jgi:hypothetical protein
MAALQTPRHSGRLERATPNVDSPPSAPYNRSFRRACPGGHGAQVAQLVEHCTENAGVGGSIPPLGTTTFPNFNCFKCLEAEALSLGQFLLRLPRFAHINYTHR